MRYREASHKVIALKRTLIIIAPDSRKQGKFGCGLQGSHPRFYPESVSGVWQAMAGLLTCFPPERLPVRSTTNSGWVLNRL